MNKVDKLQLEAKKHQDKEFRRLFTLVEGKIRGNWIIRILTLNKYGKPINATKEEQQALLKDLEECNNIDLIHYLTKSPFSSYKEYISQVNTWLELENLCYQYPTKLTYTVGTMGQVTEVIRKRHNYLDFKKAIFGYAKEESI